jgi:hypothetical protein
VAERTPRGRVDSARCCVEGHVLWDSSQLTEKCNRLDTYSDRTVITQVG